MARGFDLDPTFFRDLLASDGVGDVVHIYANRVAARASTLAPDDPETAGSSIAEGIVVDRGVEHGRQVARVNALDFKSHWHEHGTSKMAATPFLRPAAEQEVGPLEADPRGD